MFRNEAQQLSVRAVTAQDNARGDAENISGQVRIDDGDWAPLTNSVIESPAGSGNYVVALLAKETDGEKLEFNFQSTTDGVVCVAMPDPVQYTRVRSTASFPSESEVLEGVTYGPTGADSTGNVILPSTSDVRKGVTFGPNGSLIGTYEVIDGDPGTGSETVTVHVHEEGNVSAGIQGVEVSVANSSRVVRTNSSGDAIFYMDPGEYTWSFLMPAGYDPIPADTQTISAGENPTFNYEAIKTSSGAGLTNVVAKVELNGAPVEGAVVTANLTKPNQSVMGKTVVPSTHRAEAVTDASGQAILTLYNENSFDHGDGVYSISAKHCGKTVWTLNSTIPPGDTVYLPELVPAQV